MRSVFLDDADPEAISHAVRDVLEKRGALIAEHRHSRVKFHGLKPQKLSWPRAGYVGIYQHLGEREAEVRFYLRARIPWRVLWTVCILNVFLLVFAFATNAAPTAWTMMALLGGLLLLGASVLYVGTLKSVRNEERAIMEAFERAFAAIPDVDVVREEERELADLEAELEGEITRRKLAASRPPREKTPRKRFGLRPAKKGEAEGEAAPEPEAEETPEARRERLLARKAELEARRAERETQETEQEEQSRGRGR